MENTVIDTEYGYSVAELGALIEAAAQRDHDDPYTVVTAFEVATANNDAVGTLWFSVEGSKATITAVQSHDGYSADDLCTALANLELKAFGKVKRGEQ